VTGNETYLHHFTPQTKQDWIHRKYVTCPKTKISVFFYLRWLEGYAEGDFYVEFSLMAQTPTLTPTATRCEDLYRLLKGRDMGDLSQGLIHLHDNAIPKNRTSDTKDVGIISLWRLLHHSPNIFHNSPSNYDLLDFYSNIREVTDLTVMRKCKYNI